MIWVRLGANVAGMFGHKYHSPQSPINPFLASVAIATNRRTSNWHLPHLNPPPISQPGIRRFFLFSSHFGSLTPGRPRHLTSVSLGLAEPSRNAPPPQRVAVTVSTRDFHRAPGLIEGRPHFAGESGSSLHFVLAARSRSIGVQDGSGSLSVPDRNRELPVNYLGQFNRG